MKWLNKRIGASFKNNSHLALLKLIQNAVTYNAYAPLPFELILPSNITILFKTIDLYLKKGM